MTLTYEVNEDNSVTILNDGSVFLVQSDDPRVEGFDPFESSDSAREWAEEAIARYASEIAETAAKLEEGKAEAEANLAAVEATNGATLINIVEPTTETESE